MPDTGRRGFVIGVLSTVGGLLALGYAFVAERFMLPPPESASTMQKVGASGDFVAGQVKMVQYLGDGGFPDGVYVARTDKGLLALDEHCAHLQCPVQWTAGVREFLCPCHGSVYNQYGINVGGPAPHPLNFHKIVEDAGEVYIGGIVQWGTPEWTRMAQALGITGKWVAGSVPGTQRWSSKA